MSKKITLKQLSQKKYNLVKGMDEQMMASLGEVEDSFDMIIYGASGHGKSNFTAMVIKSLVKALKCKCSYVNYEEGHGKTVKDTLIGRHDMLKEVGNKVTIIDHYTYEQLDQELAKRRSAKVWVIDSLQAARLTAHQCLTLKEKYIKARNGKILIYISWSEGKFPQGAVGKSVEYFANIKIRAENLIAFVKSRYGGNKNFVINEELARQRWGTKMYNKLKKQ